MFAERGAFVAEERGEMSGAAKDTDQQRMLGIATMTLVLVATSSVRDRILGKNGGGDGGGSSASMWVGAMREGMDNVEISEEGAGVGAAVTAETEAMVVGSAEPLITSYACKRRYAALLRL